MRALILLALVALLAPAAADHVYSHRYVVEGRLIGSDALPLPGREIRLVASGIDLLQPCDDGHSPVTDMFGDFRFCYHQHDLPPGGRVTLTAGNATATRPVEIAYRRSVLFLREPNETGIAPPDWSTTYRVSGRAWSAGPTTLEGVHVFGNATAQTPVNLTIASADGNESVFRSETDDFGDFDLVLETEADPADLSLLIEMFGRSQPASLNATFHRTYVTVHTPGTIPTITDAPPADPQGSERPGTRTPRLDGTLLVIGGAGLALTLFLAFRKAR